jgi:thioredoxin reductase (NADPH)
MTKPVILAIDDESDVLNAVERDLRRHFGGEYRIMKASSGQEALEAVRELKRRGTAVALLLADQRMPVMSGTEFLEKAIGVYPDVKRALLTAYADTQAAIQSINRLGLDYYFMKPWDPPERELFPVLEDLLADWSAGHRPPFEGIRVLGTLWSPRSHQVKDFLTRNQIPYQWLDVDKDEEARRLQASLDGELRLPVVLFPDGGLLADPDTRALAERTGLQTAAARPFYDLVIIGGGPAGLASAVYAASEGLRTVLVEREATGGQAGTSALIENYLGFPKGLSGADLARRATSQARRFGVEILSTEAAAVRREDPYRFVRLADGTELSCHALLIATGVSHRRLEVPGEERLAGAGLYYGAALTEARNYRGQEVVVLGGGNSAGQGALFLSGHARTVHLSVRGESLAPTMSAYLVRQLEAIPNVHLLPRTEVRELRGETHLEEVVLVQRDSGGEQVLPAAALFAFIGAVAHTQVVAGVVERDSSGFILTGPDIGSNGARPRSWSLQRDPFLMETSVPGIFAAGDVRHLSVKRVGAAVGEGSVVVAQIHQYLKTV